MSASQVDQKDFSSEKAARNGVTSNSCTRFWKRMSNKLMLLCLLTFGNAPTETLAEKKNPKSHTCL